MWRETNSGNGRHFVLPEPMVEMWCPASGRPGAFDVRNKQEAAFIQKHQVGATFYGFFLSQASGTVPAFDRLFVPLEGTALGLLTAPAHAQQEPPHMIRVIRHMKAVLDYLGYSL